MPVKEELPHRVPGATPIPRRRNWRSPTDTATLLRLSNALRRWAAMGKPGGQVNRRRACDSHTGLFDSLAAQAGSLGYRLIREAGTPARWSLLDASDGETLYGACTLTDIARYLDG